MYLMNRKITPKILLDKCLILLIPKKLGLQKSYLYHGIFPTNFSITLGAAPCNHSCLFCPQSISKPKKVQWLELQVLEKILHEMPPDNIQLNVSSYSETMKNPVLFPALELMKTIRPNLPIVVATNGTQISEEQVRKLIDIGLDELQFSFDAADRESYRELIQSDHFVQAEQSLEMICRIRDEGRSKMKILTHIMAFGNQVSGFECFKKKWGKKVDCISFRNVGNWGNEGLFLKKRLEEKGFIPLYKTPEMRYPCTSIFMHFKVGPDGFYYPCVAHIPSDNPEESQLNALGDARKITFREAWDRLNSLRKKHLDGDWDKCPCCTTCDLWGFWKDMWYIRDGKYGIDKSIESQDFWK
jgi:MoaA/NifB/PqqE/SkfB family radical SAM enzyme